MICLRSAVLDVLSAIQTYVSAPELARFAATHMAGGGEMLSGDAVAELLETPVETHDFRGQRYGLGLTSLDGPWERVLSHGGNDGRFSARWPSSRPAASAWSCS